MNFWCTIYNIIIAPISLVFLGGLISTIIYFIFWKEKEKRTARKAFKSVWIPSQKLKYKDLSGRKEFPEKSPSTQNNLKNQIQKIINNKKNILLVGEAMAGKTYFTINYLKTLKNAFILIPNYDKFDKLFDFIPKAPKNAHYKFILIDDIYTYFNIGVTRLPSFLEKAIDDGYIIWANTTSGSDYEIVHNNLSIKLLSTFSDVEIPSSLSKVEALKIAKSEGIDKLPSYFDGNIGSIFYDIIQIRQQYDKLDGIEKSLLQTIKQLYLIGIYQPPFLIFKSDLYKLFDIYQPKISSETISNKIDKLEKIDFLHYSRDPKCICFEEKYLRLIVEPNLKIKDFLNSISTLFPDNVATLTQAMQLATTYSEALKKYQEMRSKNIQPDQIVFSILIKMANDSDIGLTWLKEMDKLSVSPNKRLVNVLLQTTNGDFKKRERVISELKSKSVELKEFIENLFDPSRKNLDLSSYIILLNLSECYEKAKAIFEEMIENNIPPNKTSFNILMNLSNDYTEAKKLFERMKNYGISPNVVTYSSLIKCSNDYTKARELYDEMIKKGIKPDAITYITLMNLSKDYTKANELYERMIHDGIYPNVMIYNSLIKLSNDYTEADKLYYKMVQEGIKPDAITYNFLINYSNDYTKARELFGRMKGDGISPDVVIYSSLMKCSNDYTKARELYDEMIKKGIKPDAITYITLMNLPIDYTKARALYNAMIKEGIKPDVVTYNFLMNLSNDYTEAKELYEKMKGDGINPNVVTYSTLMNLSKDYAKAKELYEKMKDDGINPNVVIYNCLMKLSNDYTEAKKLFERMINERINPNVRTYNQLMYISKNFSIALRLLKEMHTKNILTNNYTYKNLIALTKGDKKKQDELKKTWKKRS